MQKRYTYYYQLLVSDETAKTNAEPAATTAAGTRPGIYECLRKSLETGKKATGASSLGAMPADEYRMRMGTGKIYDPRTSEEVLTYRHVENAVS
jgi:hypothetical protein